MPAVAKRVCGGNAPRGVKIAFEREHQSPCRGRNRIFSPNLKVRSHTPPSSRAHPATMPREIITLQVGQCGNQSM